MEESKRQEQSRQERIAKAKKDIADAELELQKHPPLEPPRDKIGKKQQQNINHDDEALTVNRRRSLRSQGRLQVECSETKKNPREQISFKKSPRQLGPVSMREVSTFCQSDETLVKEIMGLNGGCRVKGSVDFKSMKLEPNNIARVLEGRITGVQFVPSKDKRMVVVGNKFGNIGFWNMDTDQRDGIYVYYPHSGPVSGISVHHFSLSKIISSCYDGFIRVLDVEKEIFDLAYYSEEEIFSISRRCDDTNTLFFAEGYGNVGVWDGRCGKALLSWDLHEDCIRTIDFNSQNTNVMVTSSKDSTVCIWDVRKLDQAEPKSLKLVKHDKAVNSAYFSPSGTRIATTSIDNKIGVVSGVNYDVESMIYHYNETPRWISTLRGIWGWDDCFVLIGNVGKKKEKGVDIVSADDKTVCCSVVSPLVSAIPCRFDAHPLIPGMLAGCTAGGQVYAWDL